MPSNLVALGFPPARLSIHGVLMTNPGQIDPGYQGHLHLTVINMSKEPLPLNRGERIIRLILAKLDAAPRADYQARHPGMPTTPINDELLQELSIDFLNVDQRTSDAVKSAQLKANMWSVCIGALIGIVVSAAAAIVPRYFDDYYTLESGITKLGAQIEVATLKDRVDQMDSILNRITSASVPIQSPSTSAPMSFPPPVSAPVSTPLPTPSPTPARTTTH